VEGILALVNKKGDVFDFVNVATAMNTLQKVAKRGKGEHAWKAEGKRLSEDPRFARLIDSVRVHCPRFRAFEGANVLHALGVLQADLGAPAVDEKLAAQLAEVVAREARAMIPQAVSNTLNALSKLEVAAAAVSPSGWTGLAKAVERTVSEMNSQDVANTLNALSKLEAAAAAVTPPGWVGMAEAVGRTASEMNPQNIANTLNALSKLEAAAAAVSPPGWAGLAEAVGRTAGEMKPREVAMTLDALGVLPAAAAKLSPSARKHLEAAAESEAPINELP